MNLKFIDLRDANIPNVRFALWDLNGKDFYSTGKKHAWHDWKELEDSGAHLAYAMPKSYKRELAYILNKCPEWIMEP